jgi:hypothetical protein
MGALGIIVLQQIDLDMSLAAKFISNRVTGKYHSVEENIYPFQVKCWL